MSKKISDIDKNFKAAEKAHSGMKYCDVMEPPFDISGFNWLETDKVYCRMPQNILKTLPPLVEGLTWHTAGGVLRFKSDSPTLAIRADLGEYFDMSHMTRACSGGFDVYLGSGQAKSHYITVMPQQGEFEIDAVIAENFSRELREWTINFPLYGGVKKVLIGTEAGTKILPPEPYAIEKPIVFYGSSITQGGCACRPGNSYTHHICRWLDAKMLNFGFSGNAKGEPEIAEIFSRLEMSAFVLDYDHNAPSVEHLAKTHEPFFKIIRAAQKDLPIIIVSAPSVYLDRRNCIERRDVIEQAYKNAKAAGDKNVYFVDGTKLMGKTDRDACTVDVCHPNDLGFMRMAEGIYPVVKEALGESTET